MGVTPLGSFKRVFEFSFDASKRDSGGFRELRDDRA